MESIKPHYHIEKIPDYSGNFKFGYLLVINKALADYWGEELVCQYNKCVNTIKLPAYFCNDKRKLYCSKCEGAVNGINTCDLQQNDNHTHLRIIEIEVRPDEEEIKIINNEEKKEDVYTKS